MKQYFEISLETKEAFKVKDFKLSQEGFSF